MIRETRIRKADAEDAESVLALAEAFATSFQVEPQRFRESYLRLIADQHADCFLAEIEDRIIGYVLAFHHLTFYANGLVSWVEEIMVTPEHRTTGVGRALMSQVEESAARRGSRMVALATRRAAPFYTALDYADSATYFRKLL